MSEKALVIVESPTKAKTITKFLGRDYIVKASNGHVRDLPDSATEIPPKLKKESWARLGVNVDSDFEPIYIIPKNKREHVKQLQAALKDADILYLATDEDREGESISWHLFELLKPKVPVKRLVFHEITKEAIKNSIDTARRIDESLVKAQETRRIIDRLFGYEVSPLLWKKMAPGLSAGRVQSVAVRLLVERERARVRFRSAQFLGLRALFDKRPAQADEPSVDAEIISVGNNRVAIGKDFDPETGLLTDKSGVAILNRPDAERIVAAIQEKDSVVKTVDSKPFTSRPSAPFVTSTLQQESNAKLRFSAKRTMGIAQQLYENGFITYMRTDSTTLSEEALRGARSLIEREYGNQYLFPTPRVYTTKVRNAQEAHEAIRPAGENFAEPDAVRNQLGEDAYKLYDLIWKRTVASQMADAKGTHTVVTLTCDDATFRATGKTIEFPGYLRAYVEGSDDPEGDLSDQERILPKLEVGSVLRAKKAEILERSTQPPPRFTEGSLIKELERLGIGRPSTWATIVELVLNRSYAFKRGTALCPTFVAMAVVRLLEQHFPTYLDFEYTAKLEDDLDAISRGESESLSYLKRFYHGNGNPGLKALVKLGEEKIDPRIVNGLEVGTMSDGKTVEVRIGRYGPFLTDGERRARIPDEVPPDEISIEKALELLEASNQEPESVGIHPEMGLPIYLKTGPYGPYLQLGEMVDGKKPKMASLLKGTAPGDVNMEYAVKLLSLPRNVGEHPELKQSIIVSNGRFGPYIKCGEETRSIPADGVSPLDMTLNDAIELLKQPKGRGRGSKPVPLRELGKHPQSEKTLTIMTGRYGPYVTDGEINASLPRDQKQEDLTIPQAISLLDARAQKIADEPPRKRKGKAKKATPTPKAAGSKKKKKTTDESAATE